MMAAEEMVTVPLSRYLELLKLEEVKKLLVQVQCEQNSGRLHFAQKSSLTPAQFDWMDQIETSSTW